MERLQPKHTTNKHVWLRVTFLHPTTTHLLDPEKPGVFHVDVRTVQAMDSDSDREITWNELGIQRWCSEGFLGIDFGRFLLRQNKVWCSKKVSETYMEKHIHSNTIHIPEAHIASWWWLFQSCCVFFVLLENYHFCIGDTSTHYMVGFFSQPVIR